MNTGQSSQSASGQEFTPNSRHNDGWRDLGHVSLRLLELITEKPSLASDLAPILAQLQKATHQLREQYDELATSITSPHIPAPDNMSQSANPGWGAPPLPPLHSNANTDVYYRTSGSSLREITEPENRVRLQINEDDYQAIAQALKSLPNPHHFSAKELRSCLINNNKERVVPETQLYLVLRFWRKMGLITKVGGRRFAADTEIKQSQLVKAAMSAWDSVGE